MSLWIVGLWGVLAGLCALILTKFMIRINIKDVPNIRSSHLQATPKSGGVAVAIPFIVSICLYEVLFSFSPPFLTALLIGSIVMLVMGFWDDLKGLSWKTRLTLQTVVAFFVVASGIYFDTISLPFFGNISLGFWGPILSGLGIIAFINLYNFMDGLNGLASGSTLIGLFFYGIILWRFLFLIDAGIFTFFCVVVLGASLIPVFVFNFPKGRIFLGGGSEFLGFVLPVLGMIGTFETGDKSHSQLWTEFSGVTPFLIPLLFFNFIFDGLITLIRRWLRGRKIWEADRGHLFHELLKRGIRAHNVTYIHFIFFGLQGMTAFYFTFFELPRFFVLSFIFILLLHVVYATWTLGYKKLRK